ncbi:tyrosine-type recombinase/integrase [Bradyrhizobium sp. 2]|uniref:tyrosine-type recombinase/integrase n=1 Tax=Bradyrhizobium sp. 2 TaxID=190045 RepID=UPI001FF98862|nr:tyrosine-type recombinase/integrase [Bradyrhizobium sp. 2]MCK1460931.1 tyrosine-type recombinase/integrase [Bradyrhizobium sp. 2]
MSIYRPKRSPFWHYDFRIDRYRFSGSTKLRNEDDAARFEEARKVDAQIVVDRIRAASAEPLTLKAACDRWWNDHGSTLSDAKIKSALDRLVEIIGAKTYLHDINDDIVARLVDERRQDVRRDSTDDEGRQLYRPITPTTVNRTLDLLRRVVRRARDNWNAAIVREPVWKRHRLKEKRRHVREISATEETALDQVEDLDFAELRRFAIITGLRRKDLLLTWSQVDFELAVIRVVAKGGVPRVLPLSAEAYALLWKRRGQHPEFAFTYKAKRTWRDRTRKGRKLGDLVKGQRYPITYYGLGSNKRKWKKAGVDARIHDLRHTTGMRTLRRTGNLRVVQKILGHTDIAITAKFYTDATVEDMRAAMEATAPRQVEQIQPKALEDKGGK